MQVVEPLATIQRLTSYELAALPCPMIGKAIGKYWPRIQPEPEKKSAKFTLNSKRFPRLKSTFPL